MRPAYLQDKWYPGNERDCRNAMDHFADSTSPKAGNYKSLIAPHAGWFFSGQAMGQGYRWLQEANTHADLVVVFGAHRGPFGPNTVFCGDSWETPVGILDNAQDVAREIKTELGFASEPEKTGRPDNAAEVHMPFVKHFFPKAEILMMGIAADPSALKIGEAVARITNHFGRQTVFIGSTDLTHYGPQYDYVPQGVGPDAETWVREQNDRSFIEPMLEGDPIRAMQSAQSDLSACCPGAALAGWQAAQTDQADRSRGTEIIHYLSADVRPAENFVGYCSLIF